MPFWNLSGRLIYTQMIVACSQGLGDAHESKIPCQKSKI